MKFLNVLLISFDKPLISLLSDMLIALSGSHTRTLFLKFISSIPQRAVSESNGYAHGVIDDNLSAL